MSVRVDAGNLEKALSDKMVILGDNGVKLLAKKLAKHVKSHIPILSSYGRANKAAVPHEYKADPGDIMKSTKVVQSQKYLHSWLVNVQDWRAHFLESGTRPHGIIPKKNAGKKNLVFLGKNGTLKFIKAVSHPGMKGAGFLKEAAEDSNVNGYMREVAKELSLY